jgi:hypothetical protein
MQNMIVLAEINRQDLIPDIELNAYRSAMQDLMSGTMLESNQALFDKHLKV